MNLIEKKYIKEESARRNLVVKVVIEIHGNHRIIFISRPPLFNSKFIDFWYVNHSYFGQFKALKLKCDKF
jgi:hypothetical protein